MSAFKARKWIELSWLRRGHKEIPLPEIIFDVGSQDIGGGYYHPQQNEVLIGKRYFDLYKGLIIINPIYDEKFILNSTCHEWRHHWQWLNGIGGITKFDASIQYKPAIIKFFSKQFTELDALLFSLKMAPEDTALLWFDWLIKSKVKNARTK